MKLSFLNLYRIVVNLFNKYLSKNVNTQQNIKIVYIFFKLLWRLRTFL